MNKKSYLRINSKQEAEIFFFSSIFLHFNFKNIAKKRKRNKCYESVTASVEDTKGEAGSPDDVPGRRPGRDMVVGHGLGHWPCCGTQRHLTGADNAWARPPHNWQTKSGSECEKWVMATRMRLSPSPPRWAATDGEATGRTPRSLLAVLLRKFGSTHQPVSLAAVTCRRWKPLHAHSPAYTCHCSHAPPKATLLLSQLRLSHPSPLPAPPAALAQPAPTSTYGWSPPSSGFHFQSHIPRHPTLSREADWDKGHRAGLAWIPPSLMLPCALSLAKQRDGWGREHGHVDESALLPNHSGFSPKVKLPGCLWLQRKSTTRLLQERQVGTHLHAGTCGEEDTRTVVSASSAVHSSLGRIAHFPSPLL